jgi:hypothetical protein
VIPPVLRERFEDTGKAKSVPGQIMDILAQTVQSRSSPPRKTGLISSGKKPITVTESKRPKEGRERRW